MVELPVLGDVIVDRGSTDSAVRKLKVNVIARSFARPFTRSFARLFVTLCIRINSQYFYGAQKRTSRLDYQPLFGKKLAFTFIYCMQNVSWCPYLLYNQVVYLRNRFGMN